MSASTREYEGAPLSGTDPLPYKKTAGLLTNSLF